MGVVVRPAHERGRTGLEATEHCALGRVAPVLALVPALHGVAWLVPHLSYISAAQKKKGFGLSRKSPGTLRRATDFSNVAAHNTIEIPITPN